MKHTLTLALVMLGCAHGVADPVPSLENEASTPTPEPKIDDYPSSNGEDTLSCDRREIVEFEIDGQIVRFKVPSLCDPTPYIEKGDPPPWIKQNPSTPTFY